MTYFKCVPCKTRLYSAADADTLVSDLCPDCGAILAPVGELVELVGYRSIGPTEPQAEYGTVIVDRFGELLAAKRARSLQAALDAERWLDDGGSFDGAAAASAA